MERGGTETLDHALARLLVQRGLLAPERLQEALGAGAGQRLEAVLLRQGHVQPSTLHALRGVSLAWGCRACGATRAETLAGLEATQARCGCGGALALVEGNAAAAPPGPLMTPHTGSGTRRWRAPPDEAPHSPAAGSGSARLIAPAGSGTAHWKAHQGGVPGLPPGIGGQCGPYQLLDELGSGGYGVVFRAWDPRAEREVAIKLLTSASPRARQRFAREVQATARLRHPSIVPLLDHGEHAGTLYLVMELIRGRTLAERSQGPDRLPLEACVRVVRDVARAIAHAHEEGVLHRDLKPHNVLVDPQGRPHVVDFGLAQLDERASQLTRTGAAIGTPAYMPPEQARSDGGADARSDVYALGATLYHALTGRPPFGGESGPEMLLAIFRADPDPPSRHDRRVPVDLDTVCLKCLEKDPARRYQGAAALADDLDRWLAGQPIAARPPSTVRRGARRLRRWAAPRRRGLTGVAACAALLALGGGWWAVERRPTEALPGAGAVLPGSQPGPDEAEARARSAARIAACEALLQQVEERPLEQDLDQALHALCREPDPALARALGERLTELSGLLWQVEEELLAGVAQPDPDEARAGALPLEGLAAALAARRADPLAAPQPAQAEVLKEAEERLQRRVYRGMSAEARRTPPRLLDIVASRQEARLGRGRLMVARLACEALGRLAAPEGVAGLQRYLLREADPLRALYAAQALAQIDDPSALPLEAARARFGDEGLLGEQLRRARDGRF